MANSPGPNAPGAPVFCVARFFIASEGKIRGISFLRAGALGEGLRPYSVVPGGDSLKSSHASLTSLS